MLSLPFGEPARLSVALAVNGADTDSTAMTLTVEEPDGTITGKILSDFTHDSLGHYHYDFPTTKAGMHSFAFNSTSGVKAAAQDVFFVQPLLPA
jgi:hypothetical protein